MPHPFAQVYVYHCPHVGEWVLHLGRGSVEDPAEVTTTVRFGPFDTLEDVLDYTRSWVLRSLPSPPG